MTTNATPNSIYAKERLQTAVTNLSVTEFQNLIQRAGITNSDIIAWRDDNQNTLIHLSISKNRLEMTRFILRLCNNENINHFLNSHNKFGKTALHLSVYQDSYDAINILVDAGADIQINNEIEFQTPIDIAINRYNISSITTLLKNVSIAKKISILSKYKYDLGFDINNTGNIDYSALQYYMTFPGDKNTKLHTAALKNQVMDLKFYLALFGYMNQKNIDIRTPIHLACVYNSLDAIETFFTNSGHNFNVLYQGSITEESIKIGMQDHLMDTELHSLIKNCQKTNLTNSSYLNKFLETIDVLCSNWTEQSTNINTLNSDGMSILHYAIINDLSISVIKKLIDKGADISINFPDGRTCLEMANYFQYFSIANIISSSASPHSMVHNPPPLPESAISIADSNPSITFNHNEYAIPDEPPSLYRQIGA